ncbi:RHS repeat domain-containing protein [Myroides sp. WP-1]|uniref:RHS repeat domain-containing protein n=1 Tax=Myroides sp. WP-1 TaxID=2759944 RepID=UPI0015F9625A|nr:RHS repeat-associated core domain-containing protein [Myroides sp. WP-1]MBB1139566.1 hypothetical protein [Myroides sp. WP-1]
MKSPVSIHEENKEDLYFEYNGAGERTVMYYGNMANTKEQSLYQRYYSSDGSIEITYNTQNQSIDYVYYVDGDAYNATVLAKGDGIKGKQYYYLHRDYLSSIVAITNQYGTIVEKRHFDAWGTAVKIMDGQGQVLNQLTFTDRGYTGHEHLQGINIIQMNGRLYDPYLRRFMAPDNYIQDPTNTQNFNRYGYVWNNPLKYTDPSGEEGISFTAAVIIGAVVAMTTYTMTALLADVPFTAGGFTKSAIFGAVSGAVSFGVGEMFQSANTVVTVQQAMAQALAHGMSQGIISAVQGGNFGSSFSSAAISSLLSAGFLKYGSSIKDNTVAMIAFSTVSGGGVSALTGGHFWEGAATAFYVSLLNHSVHNANSKKGDKESTANVYIETDGVGHVYVEVDGVVYSYGRYNGSYSPASGSLGPYGDGVLLRLEGENALNFVAERTSKYPTSRFAVEVNGSKVKAYYDRMYNSGQKISGKSGYMSFARVVDTYGLIGPGGNNCTTITYKGLNKGGANINASQTPAGMLYDFQKLQSIKNGYNPSFQGPKL